MSVTSRTRSIVRLAVGAAVLGACSSAAVGSAPVASLTASAADPVRAGAPAVAAVLPPTGTAGSAAGANGAVDDRRVFVEGDSLTVGMSVDLPTMLDAAGWTVTIDAQIGRATAAGVSVLAQRADEIGGTLVVGLGTNDLPDPAAFSDRIDEVMSVAAGRRVIWVTVGRQGWDGLDEVLIAAQSRWTNLHVIDWRPVIAQFPTMQAGDGIHLTEEGYRLRAAFVAAAIEAAA